MANSQVLTARASSVRDLGGDSHFLPTLDGWRGIAILAVVVGHWLLTTPGNVIGSSPFLQVITRYSLGPQGVSLFFAISGYLITTRLLIEMERTGGISLSNFYIRRAARILPAALTYLGVVVIMAALGLWAAGRGELLSALFFYSNYFRGRTLTSDFWSLSMEEQFYLFWPSLLAFAKPRSAAWVAAVVAVLVSAWRPWAFVHTHLGDYNLQRTDLRLDAFMMPCLLAILLKSKGCGDALKLKLGRSTAFVIAALLLLTAYAVGIPRTTWWSPWQELSTATFMPVLIVSTVLNPGSIMGRILQWAPLAWVGRISYSVYLWHKVPLSLFEHRSLGGVITLFPVYFVLALALSAASYYVIEKPLIALGRRAAKRFARPQTELGAGLKNRLLSRTAAVR